MILAICCDHWCSFLCFLHSQIYFDLSVECILKTTIFGKSLLMSSELDVFLCISPFTFLEESLDHTAHMASVVRPCCMQPQRLLKLRSSEPALRERGTVCRETEELKMSFCLLSPIATKEKVAGSVQEAIWQICTWKTPYCHAWP